MAERRRRVLVLNHFAAPRGQAGGTRHVELFGRLEGWDYLIIASDLNPQTGGRLKSEPGFVVVHAPEYSSNGISRIRNWVAYAFRATWIGLVQPGVDLVYGSSPHLLAALAAWIIAFAKRVPFVMEVRDLWPQVLVDMGGWNAGSLVVRLLTKIEEFLYARATAVVVLSEGSRVNLLGRGVAPEKVHYVPNGADPDDFSPRASREELRERYGFTKFTAVYAGAHGPANGLDIALDTALTFDPGALDVVLVGGGVEKDRLIARAQREGISNVRFLDPVPKSEIADLLHAADIGLHILADVELFRTAVSPNKLFDYLAAGLPVVTNCPGSVGDLVIDSGGGWVTEPSALGAGIRHVLNTDGAELRSHGMSGRAWIAEHQSRTAMAKRVERVLIAALKGGTHHER